MDLSTTYMGLKLASPVIAASSGLTGNLESIIRLEKNGAAAVVLKSIFEEEILLDMNQQLREAEKDPLVYSGLSETLDYLDVHIREKNLKCPGEAKLNQFSHYQNGGGLVTISRCFCNKDPDHRIPV